MGTGVSDYKDNWKAEKYEEADLDSYMMGRFQKFHYVLSDMVGRFSLEEINSVFQEKTGFELRMSECPKFFGYVDKKGEIKVRRSQDGIVIGDFRKRYEKHKEKIDDEFEEILDFCVGRGRSPTTVRAAIEFLDTDRSGRSLASEYNITDVSVLENKDFIIENSDEFSDTVVERLELNSLP